jgi:hypothetical protein
MAVFRVWCAVKDSNLQLSVSKTAVSTNFTNCAAIWLQRLESNQRPKGYEPSDLPLIYSAQILVRPEGFEPSTSRVEADCSRPLSYGRDGPP